MTQQITRASLEAKTITELRRMSRGVVKGGYDMKKADLIDALLAAQGGSATVSDPRSLAPQKAEDEPVVRRQRRKAKRAKRSERTIHTDAEGVTSTTVKHYAHTATPPSARRARNRNRNKQARRSRKANR